MRLFGTLMERYFKGTPSTDCNQEMLLLRLTALNFYDVPVNLKPLFEQLNAKLKSAEEKNKLIQKILSANGSGKGGGR